MLVWYRSIHLPIRFFLHIYPLLKKSTFKKWSKTTYIEFCSKDLIYFYSTFLKSSFAPLFLKVGLVASNSSLRRLTRFRIITAI
jgi:hypothetical protein